MNKPTNFNDLLELQRVLDEEIEKTRNNGFVPRERSELDILLSIDDEFQEWLRELPYEDNFKTWKQKEYSGEKELEELTDVLFFLLQYTLSFIKKEKQHKYDFSTIEKYMNKINYPFMFYDYFGESPNLELAIKFFKIKIWINNYIDELFTAYFLIVNLRGVSKEKLLNTYWEKWQKNMTRINKDWILEGK